MQQNLCFLLALAGVCLSSCGPKKLVDASRVLESQVWTYADSLRFEATVEDTSCLYDISILVKHDKSYAYQNLYLRIRTYFPDGKMLAQPLSLDLAEKTGAWSGKCIGNSCSIEAPIQQNAFFNAQGKYVFVLEQYMRQDTLRGIRAVGLRIADAGPR
ncbi:MAG: hypothetical protein RL386_1752 [Bacteroidota bacterium]